MRALLQRVTRAAVDVGEERIAEIDAGLLILVCAMAGDCPADAERLAAKIVKLRIFRDDDGRMNRALSDTGGHALVVSQFTLAADTRRGNRPGFSAAAPPEQGEMLYTHFADALEAIGISTQRGRFGADMAVSLVNDGPVTIWLDTSE
ncbi:D-tyrosyl-tRNA(Tyr) deacylase [Poseidonocella pacifica]|uniref:D-aminoacyl-tRNA deacylase n=1 Tax=Poseidonocella pacifica TaxID=871651 RepID=A0A1I0WEP6_9RHOB|nr:D-aminoacyl-tRNA deacylase [Poseidonocella pacifica]SFA87192.1 D-tyrosyl-tRNA(Tyr) deacylase [Poseidonocella pacifica]